MQYSGYTLQLQCDKCSVKVQHGEGQAEFTSDGPTCRVDCYNQARAAGWTMGVNRKCYCPTHSKEIGPKGYRRAAPADINT